MTSKRICSECSSSKHVTWNRKHQRLLCKQCAGEPCSICGKKKPVNTRTPEGRSLCAQCAHNSHVEPCFICEKQRPVAVRTPEGYALCNTCYQKQYKGEKVTEHITNLKKDIL